MILCITWLSGLLCPNILQSLTSGEGKCVGIWSPRGLVTKALPKIEIKCWAMVFCCSTLQWFSKDRITGYSDVWWSKQWHCFQSGTHGKHTRRTSSTSPKTNRSIRYVLYLFTLKAYSLMAWITSLKRIFEVRVYPW